MAVVYDLRGRTVITSGVGTYDLPGAVIREVDAGLVELEAELEVTDSSDTIAVVGFREVVDSTTRRVHDLRGRTVITASATRRYDLLGVVINENAANTGVEGTLVVTESSDTLVVELESASSTRRIYDRRGRTLIDRGLRSFDLPGLGVIEHDIAVQQSVQGEMVVTESSDTFAAQTFGGLTVDCDVDVLIDSELEDAGTTDTPAVAAVVALASVSTVTEDSDTPAVEAAVEIDGVLTLTESDELLFIVQEDEATVGFFPIIESSDTVAIAGTFEQDATLVVSESTDTVSFVGANAIAAAIDGDEEAAGFFEGRDFLEAEISRIVGAIAITEDDDTAEFSDDDVAIDPVPVIVLTEDSDTMSIVVTGWTVQSPSDSVWTTVTPVETEWAEAA